MRPGLLMGALLVTLSAGCAEPNRPDFLVRLQEDCRSGDQDACGLLALPNAPAAGRSSQPGVRPRSLVQRDVEAIMRGMDRTRATPRFPLAPTEGVR